MPIHKQINQKPIIGISYFLFSFFLFTCSRYFFQKYFLFWAHAICQKTKTKTKLKGESSWTAAYGNLKQYLTIDLGKRYMVNAIASQGHPNSNSFISAFYVSCSDDGHFWHAVYTRNSTYKEAYIHVFCLF